MCVRNNLMENEKRRQKRKEERAIVKRSDIYIGISALDLTANSVLAVLTASSSSHFRLVQLTG